MSLGYAMLYNLLRAIFCFKSHFVVVVFVDNSENRCKLDTF